MSFTSIAVRERHDPQRLLRVSIEVISPETKVLCDEFAFTKKWRPISTLRILRAADAGRGDTENGLRQSPWGWATGA